MDACVGICCVDFLYVFRQFIHKIAKFVTYIYDLLCVSPLSAKYILNQIPIAVHKFLCISISSSWFLFLFFSFSDSQCCLTWWYEMMVDSSSILLEDGNYSDCYLFVNQVLVTIVTGLSSGIHSNTCSNTFFIFIISSYFNQIRFVCSRAIVWSTHSALLFIICSLLFSNRFYYLFKIRFPFVWPEWNLLKFKL